VLAVVTRVTAREAMLTLDEVNDESFDLLTSCHGSEDFCQGAARLGERAQNVPQAISCLFLRLVARLSKVLRLLSSSPGPKMIVAANEWSNSKVRRAEESLRSQIDLLLKVRDVGIDEGRVSAAAAADVSSLLPKVLQTGQQIALNLASMTFSKIDPPKAVEISDDSQTSEVQQETSAAQTSTAEPSAPSRLGEAAPCQGILKRKRQSPVDIFSEPLNSELAELPKAKDAKASPVRKIRSTAPVEEGDSKVTKGDVPKPRRGYDVWTQSEEQRVIVGFEKYGRQWELIRTTCDLRHRTGSQIKDKWRQLHKRGLVKEDEE